YRRSGRFRAECAPYASPAATMNLHEYQAKDLFRSYGIPVPAGKVAASAEEAAAVTGALGGAVWVVKAQIHAGGRGKAGGVKLARDGEAVRGAEIAQSQSLTAALYRLYTDKDLSLVEVNPLIVTQSGELLALDAKINVDANALFRQGELTALRDASQEDPMERRASEHDLNY